MRLHTTSAMRCAASCDESGMRQRAAPCVRKRGAAHVLPSLFLSVWLRESEDQEMRMRRRQGGRERGATKRGKRKGFMAPRGLWQHILTLTHHPPSDCMDGCETRRAFCFSLPHPPSLPVRLGIINLGIIFALFSLSPLVLPLHPSASSPSASVSMHLALPLFLL